MNRTLSLLAVVVLSAVAAFGNERYLGTVTAVGLDGGANAMFNVRQPDAGFVIPYLSKLSVQPTGHAYVCIDSHVGNNGTISCSTLSGVFVPAGVLFPTSCSTGRPVITETQDLQADGGFSVDGGGTMTAVTIQTCTVAVIPFDGGTISAGVWARTGNEL